MFIKDNLTSVIASRFLTLPNEEVIFAQRKHWLTFLFPVISILTFCLAALATASALYFFFFPFLPLFIILVFISLTMALTLITKFVLDWYFNLYIITNRKIAEISYEFLASQQVSEILLDQVRCTEIDTKIKGLANDFLDVGDVIITFDRPTHEEEFVLRDIENPREIKTYLQRMFYANYSGKNNSDLYLKTGGKWRYMENQQTRNIQKGGDISWSI